MMFKILFIGLLFSVFISCTPYHKPKDIRPASQIEFQNKFYSYSESVYDEKMNQVLKDSVHDNWIKYAMDTVASFKEWALVVKSIEEGLSDNYKLTVYTVHRPIEDGSNMEFHYYLPKNPYSEEYKKNLGIIKKLKPLDTLFITGKLLDEDSFNSTINEWNIEAEIIRVKNISAQNDRLVSSDR